MAGFTAIRKVLGSVASVVLTVIGLTEAPDAWAKIKVWAHDLWMVPGVDWAAVFSGSGSRWLFVIAGVIVGLWTWEVPHRLVTRFRPSWLPSLKQWQRKQLVDRTWEVEQLTLALETKSRELDVMTRLRDQSLEAWQKCRRDFTLERFTHFAAKFPQTTVKIRCNGYNEDWPLAQEIKALFEKNALWAVEIDPNNDPPLIPNAECKVVLKIGDPDRLYQLHGFLDRQDGGLLKHTVCIARNPADADNDRLLVEVLPTIRGVNSDGQTH